MRSWEESVDGCRPDGDGDREGEAEIGPTWTTVRLHTLTRHWLSHQQQPENYQVRNMDHSMECCSLKSTVT